MKWKQDIISSSIPIPASNHHHLAHSKPLNLKESVKEQSSIPAQEAGTLQPGGQLCYNNRNETFPLPSVPSSWLLWCFYSSNITKVTVSRSLVSPDPSEGDELGDKKREKRDSNLIPGINKSISPPAPNPLITADNQLLSGRSTLHPASSSKESESTHQLVLSTPNVLKAYLDKKPAGRDTDSKHVISTLPPSSTTPLLCPPKG